MSAKIFSQHEVLKNGQISLLSVTSFSTGKKYCMCLVAMLELPLGCFCLLLLSDLMRFLAQCIAPDSMIFFQTKSTDIFLFLHEKVCCGYSSEVPQ